jgi:predicted phosphoribosyltransferase
VVERLRDEADEVVVLVTPQPFFAVGQWYEDFGQTSDEEVVAALKRSAAGRR